MESKTTPSPIPDLFSATLHDTTFTPVSANILQALPHELVEHIFLLFSAKDILTCRLVNREFNEIIQSSTLLQYFLACNAAGVIDNPRSSLSHAERFEALNNREDAWRRRNPVFETTIKVHHKTSSVYDLTAGIFLLGDNNLKHLHYCHLPSSPQDNPQWISLAGHGPSQGCSGRFVDMGMAVYEHDLMANVIISEAKEARVYGQRYSLDLDLLKFSTGEYHPLARHPRIHVQELPSGRFKSTLSVVGDNLALLVRSRNGSCTDKLYIFDWKTGHKRLQHEATEKSYSGLVFVSPEILLIPNLTLSHFEIWRIPSFSDPKLCKPPSQILSLKIPEISNIYRIISLKVHANPNSFLHSIPYFPPRPFLPSPDESIIVATLRLVSWEGFRAYALIMHRGALLDTIQKWTTPSLLERQEDRPMWLLNRVRINLDWVDESVPLVAQSKLVLVMPQPYWSCPTSISSSSSSSSVSSTKAVDGSRPYTSTSLYNFLQLQWGDWGPSISRWFELNDPQAQWSMNSAGQRCAFSVPDPRDERKFEISVADFNPHNFRRNAKLMARLRENSCGNSNDEEGRVEEEELEMFDHRGVFSEDVFMGLRCEVYLMPGEYDCDVVLMDEERLLGLKFNEEGRLESVRVLYFG